MNLKKRERDEKKREKKEKKLERKKIKKEKKRVKREERENERESKNILDDWKGKVKVVEVGDNKDMEYGYDSDRDKALASRGKHICPLLESAKCGAPYLGYAYRQNLLRHLRQYHPGNYEENADLSSISYTNRQATYVNNYFAALRRLKAASMDPLLPPNEDTQLFLEYKQILEDDIKDSIPTELGMDAEEIKDAEEHRYVVFVFVVMVF